MNIRWISYLLLGWLFMFQAYGQDYPKVAPKTPAPHEGKFELPAEPPAAKGDEKVIASELKGLLFVKDPNDIRKKGMPGITGVVSVGIDLLKTPEFLELMQEYIGKPVSLKSLNQLTRDVVMFYRKSDHPVVDVVLPEQNVTSGIIQVVVLEGKVGKVQVEGNQWFESSFLKEQIRSKMGDTLSLRELGEDINWINSNPFRQVDMVFTPGQKFGQTDLLLKTKDRFPIRFYTGYEDSGNDLTGDERILLGFNWGNAMKKDHQFNYQYTADDNFNKLSAHSWSYVAPLPWHHRLAFFGSHAESKADIANRLFNLTGTSWQISSRYTVPLPSFTVSLPSLRDYVHEVAAGFDYKQSNNNLEFGGAQVFNTSTDILQGTLGYNGSLRDTWGSTALGVNLFYSPGDITADNKETNFRAARAFAKPDYFYSRISLERVTKLPKDFSWIVKGTYQLADSNLLGSEQFGIGGFNTVRGYDEREANGDEGYLFSTELRTPSLSPASWFGISKITDQLQFLTFFDYGVTENNQLLPGEDPHILLASVGPGLRYALNPYLSMRADYGWQLYDTGNNKRYNSRLHLGVVVSY